MTTLRPYARSIAAAILLIVGFLLLLPVGVAYMNAIASGEILEHESLFQFSRQSMLLMRSITVAGGAAVAALVMGVLVGVAASRAGPVQRTAMGAVCASSLLTPPYVFAVAWIDLWGPMGWLYPWAPVEAGRLADSVYGVAGAAIALAAAYYPVVAIAAYVSLRRVDRRWREAASMCGRSRAYLLSIALPVTVPPIVAGAVIVFLFALYEFPVHSLMQVNTYLVEIYAASEYHDYRAAAVLSVPLVLIAALSISFVRILARVRGMGADSGIAQQNQRSERLSIVGWGSVGWIIVVFASFFPLLAVAVRAMPPTTFVRLFETAWEELGVSVLIAIVAATFITALGTLSAVVIRHPKARAIIDIVSAAPFLISGPLLGLGLIALYNRPGPAGVVYDSAAILLLAWVARFGFIAQWGIGAGVRGQSPSGVEAARIAGISWLRTQWGVVVAQARPYIAMVWGAAFVLSFREVDTAVLVAPPGMTLASVRLFTLMHYGPDGYVMAMAITMSAIVFAVGALTYWLAAQWIRLANART